jgi:hypothetical protein
MNKNLQFSFLILSVFYLSCNPNNSKKGVVSEGILSSIAFKVSTYDFGKIPANKDATATFNFSNTGKSPLVISEVKTSCGCTVPEYPKGIIKPNETGEIKVIYDAKYPGRFNKTITVFYNGKDSPKTLAIKDEVPYPKDLDSVNN